MNHFILPDLQRGFFNCSTLEIQKPLNDFGALCGTEIYLDILQVSDVAGCS